MRPVLLVPANRADPSIWSSYQLTQVAPMLFCVGLMGGVRSVATTCKRVEHSALLPSIELGNRVRGKWSSELFVLVHDLQLKVKADASNARDCCWAPLRGTASSRKFCS